MAVSGKVSAAAVVATVAAVAVTVVAREGSGSAMATVADTVVVTTVMVMAATATSVATVEIVTDVGSAAVAHSAAAVAVAAVAMAVTVAQAVEVVAVVARVDSDHGMAKAAHVATPTVLARTATRTGLDHSALATAKSAWRCAKTNQRSQRTSAQMNSNQQCCGTCVPWRKTTPIPWLVT